MSKPGASDQSAHALAPGAVIGGVYRVVGMLHDGQHGRVVEVEQMRLGRRVALKTLGTHFANEHIAQKRLIKEVELLSKLDHPHVVPVIDFNRMPDGEPYLVMELLQGESLSARLAPGQSLEIPRALTIGSHVVSALAAAHAKGICHRTLNPRHVNLIESGGGPFARVFGFALSSLAPLGQSGEHAAFSTRNLAYIAPEQRKPGAPGADELCDQYAVAVLIYHMLTGFVPEVRGGMLSLFRREKAPFSPPSAYRSGIPPALDRVILRGLSQDPSGRYPRMSDFAAALLDAGRNYLRRSSQPAMDRPSGPPALPRSSTPPYSAARPTQPPGGSSSSAHSADTIAVASGANRPSRIPSSLTSELAELEDLIRAARSAPNLSEAVDATVRALARAENTMSTQVERRVNDNHRFFEEILQRYLGGGSSVLQLHTPSGGPPSGSVLTRDAHAPSPNDAVLTPKRAFLLSRIDGVTTSAELLQLSPLPRLDTLAHLAALMRAGVIRVKA